MHTESPRSIGLTAVSTVSRTPPPLRSTAATRALSCTSPVNTSPLLQPRADEQVSVDHLVVDVEGAARVGDARDALAAEDGQRVAPTGDDRSDEQPQLVDLVDVEERAREVRPALEEDRLDAARAELAE